VVPHYIDDIYRKALTDRYHGSDTEGRYIEVRSDLTYLMESDLFRLGPGKFMGMLQKRNQSL
jgi:hypothetical protein